MTSETGKKSDLTVYEFTITKEILMGIDERERMFFVLLGHAYNEIIILQKIILSIRLFGKESGGVEEKAYVAQDTFITRLLIAKMFEAWDKLFRQLLFCSPFRRDYEQNFSHETKEACNDLGRFFAQNPYLATVRNQYVFHYPSRQLNAAMPDIPDHDDWKIYLSASYGNSLYFLSEMVASHAMFAEVDANKAEGYKKMHDDQTYIARRIIDLSTGCMNIFVQRHLGLRMEDGTAITIKVPNLLDVKLPFFTRLEPEN